MPFTNKRVPQSSSCFRFLTSPAIAIRRSKSWHLPLSQPPVTGHPFLSTKCSTKIPALFAFQFYWSSNRLDLRKPKWVCLKMVSTPTPNAFSDHYPYSMAISLGVYPIFKHTQIKGKPLHPSTNDKVLKWRWKIHSPGLQSSS